MGQPIGIGHAAGHQRIDARHDVAIVATAPVVHVGLQRALAVVGGPARIRVEHRPAPARPDLPALQASEPEAVHVGPGRSPVRHDQQGIAASGRVVHRQQQHALDFEPVMALPGDDLGPALPDLAELRIRGSQAPGPAE